MNQKIAQGIVMAVGEKNCNRIYAIKEISETKVELYDFSGQTHTIEDYSAYAQIVEPSKSAPEILLSALQVKRLYQIGDLIRGDWSGYDFDGRDVKKWINNILSGGTLENDSHFIALIEEKGYT